MRSRRFGLSYGYAATRGQGEVRRIRLRTIIYTVDIPLFVMLRYWLDGRHPIFRAEIMRPIPHPSLEGTGLDTRAARVFLRLVGDWASGLGCLIAPLFLLAPFLPWLWRVPTVISAAPPVAREVEGRTWLALRSTPYSTREIVEALHAASTYRVAQIWAYVTSMRLAVVGILAMIVMIMAWFPGREAQLRLSLLDWAAYLMSAFYFLAEPLLDSAIDGAVGIVASTFSHTQLTAVINGFLLRLILWSLQVLGLVLTLSPANAVLTRTQASNMPALVLLGPAYGLALGFSSGATIAMVVGLTALRMIGLRALMALAVWRAEAIQE
jgi:hypothetical protein